MDFQAHLTNAWNMLKREPLLLVGGNLLITLLTLVSLGILSGPLQGGYIDIQIGMLRERRKPRFNDLFAGLSRFGQLFPLFFLGLLIMTGFLVLVVPGVIFATWWLYALPLMADRGCDLAEAMRESRAKVKEKGFFMHLVFLFMITVVPGLLIDLLSAAVPLLQLLYLILFPLQYGCLASLYLEQFAPIILGAAEAGPSAAPPEAAGPADTHLPPVP